MTYKEGYNQAVECLKKAGDSEAALDAYYVFEHVTGIDRASYYVMADDEFAPDKYDRFVDYTRQVASGRPVDYVLGTRCFYGLEFDVDENVLIPRQDTEHLVENAVAYLKDKSKPVSYLDLCTGSGCIAVTIAKELSKAGVDYKALASDISEGALNVAKGNASKHEADIEFVKSDMFERLGGKYDLIVSNPPYIDKMAMDELDKKVVEHEPYGALYGGQDGLDFYRIIANEAGNYLNEDGMLMLEIGYDQGVTVPKLLEDAGYVNIRVIKDYNGLDRVVVGGYKSCLTD